MVFPSSPSLPSLIMLWCFITTILQCFNVLKLTTDQGWKYRRLHYSNAGLWPLTFQSERPKLKFKNTGYVMAPKILVLSIPTTDSMNYGQTDRATTRGPSGPKNKLDSHWCRAQMTFKWLLPLSCEFLRRRLGGPLKVLLELKLKPPMTKPDSY